MDHKWQKVVLVMTYLDFPTHFSWALVFMLPLHKHQHWVRWATASRKRTSQISPFLHSKVCFFVMNYNDCKKVFTHLNIWTVCSKDVEQGCCAKKKDQFSCWACCAANFELYENGCKIVTVWIFFPRFYKSAVEITTIYCHGVVEKLCASDSEMVVQNWNKPRTAQNCWFPSGGRKTWASHTWFITIFFRSFFTLIFAENFFNGNLWYFWYLIFFFYIKAGYHDFCVEIFVSMYQKVSQGNSWCFWDFQYFSSWL